MKWVTRERPKIDRIACPWLILRFIDADAEFLYVPATDVMKVARHMGKQPPLVHIGPEALTWQAVAAAPADVRAAGGRVLAGWVS